MANQSIIARHAAVVTTATPVNIDFGTGVQKVYITTFSNDVNVEFDGTANTDSFRVSSAQGAEALFEFTGSSVHTVSLLGNGGSANVYVMGIVT